MYRSKKTDFEDEFYCAGSVNGNFRRSSSLRLRGEKMVQRSPLSTRKFPIITEHSHPKQNGDVLRNGDYHRRARSQSFSARSNKPSIRSHETYMDRKSSPTDSAHTPPGSPEDLPDDDSIRSYGSGATGASIDAGFAPFNGTTFSGRSMKYVLHCSTHAGLSGEEYLTPTQRAQKQIRRLKNLLNQARKDLEKKDSEIFNLTKEVVELRLQKVSTCSPDDKSNSSEIVTVRENAEDASNTNENNSKHDMAPRTYDETDSPAFKDESTLRCRNSEMHGSFTDSGHFDDLTNSSLHSKDSITIHTHDASCMTDSNEQEVEKNKLIECYERKLEDLIRNHIGEIQELKQAHNDKVEALLEKLSDANHHYSELLPNYEQAKEKILLLEKQLEEASQKLAEEQNNSHSMYLKMYNKGVEAARFEKEDMGSAEAGPSNRISMQELVDQLQITQTELENVRAMYRRLIEAQRGTNVHVDPEVTLQFLKSAIYYFLTDPENHQGHLKAIENILGFTETEKNNIRKARPS